MRLYIDCWIIKLQFCILDEVHEIVLIFRSVSRKLGDKRSLWSILFCLVLFTLQVFKPPSRCFLFVETSPLLPAGPRYSAWHSTSSLWKLSHYTCTVIDFQIFLSRRWTSCLVYLGIPTVLCTCGHSKRSINVSWINKYKILLFAYANTDLSVMLSFLILFSI